MGCPSKHLFRGCLSWSSRWPLKWVNLWKRSVSLFKKKGLAAIAYTYCKGLSKYQCTTLILILTKGSHYIRLVYDLHKLIIPSHTHKHSEITQWPCRYKDLIKHSALSHLEVVPNLRIFFSSNILIKKCCARLMQLIRQVNSAVSVVQGM